MTGCSIQLSQPSFKAILFARRIRRCRGCSRRLFQVTRPQGPQSKPSGRTAVIVAEAWNATGKRVASRLQAPEAYWLTALTAVEIVRRAASGDAVLGYQTPSMAYGADFIMQFERVTRTDL